MPLLVINLRWIAAKFRGVDEMNILEGRKSIMLISCNHKGRRKLLQKLHSSDLQGFQLILLKMILDSNWKVIPNLNECQVLKGWNYY